VSSFFFFSGGRHMARHAQKIDSIRKGSNLNRSVSIILSLIAALHHIQAAVAGFAVPDRRYSPIINTGPTVGVAVVACLAHRTHLASFILIYVVVLSH
jgi:hypothetical protein